MVKNKNSKVEPVSRTITAEDMRKSIGFRYLGIMLLIFGFLGLYFINPWMVNNGRCSIQSGIMCSIGTMVSAFVFFSLILGGLISLITSYIVILSDTDEYKHYHCLDN